jgi:DNA recombination protein RmuC
VSQDLKQTRDAILTLQLSQAEELSTSRENISGRLTEMSTQLQSKHDQLRGELLARVTETLAAQGRAEQELIQNTLHHATQMLSNSVETMAKGQEARLDQMSKSTDGRLEQMTKTTDSRLTEMSKGTETRLTEMSLTTDGRLTEVSKAIENRLAEMTKTLDGRLDHLIRSNDARLEQMTKSTEGHLEKIRSNVQERLEEGFKKTNETFASVMARLATIDEAQKKIDGLATNVVSLQELLGDKRSRGAFGEIQLEALVKNILPPTAYEFQFTLSSGARADCILKLPEPTGTVALDAKFPLENYQRMFSTDLAELDRTQAHRQFRADVKKHVDDISAKYIVKGETSDWAVMFLPAEAIFAEIHAYHPEVVDYAMTRRVYIVSPTTLMAVLNTARAVLKDVETRTQVHIIKDELSKLGKEFGRFDSRMKKLADHIRQAHEDAQQVSITSDKITRRFSQIERVDLERLAEVDEYEQNLISAPAEEESGS